MNGKDLCNYFKSESNSKSLISKVKSLEMFDANLEIYDEELAEIAEFAV